MHPSVMFLAAMATVGSAAQVESVDVVHIIHTSRLRAPQNQLAGAPFHRRDDNDNTAASTPSAEECTSSELDYFGSAPTSVSDEVSSLVVGHLMGGSTCTWTAPATLSSDLMAWLTAVAEWERDTQPELQKILDECHGGVEVDKVDVMGCPTGGQVVFTGDEASSTVALATALEGVTEGDGGDEGSTGSRTMPALVVAVAAGLVSLTCLL